MHSSDKLSYLHPYFKQTTRDQYKVTSWHPVIFIVKSITFMLYKEVEDLYSVFRKYITSVRSKFRLQTDIFVINKIDIQFVLPQVFSLPICVQLLALTLVAMSIAIGYVFYCQLTNLQSLSCKKLISLVDVFYTINILYVICI